MPSLTITSWPSARQFAEVIQCPGICFASPQLSKLLPAIDRLGMPLVTSGQFAYVFKLNSPDGTGSVALRCFRGYLGDREERYKAIDARLSAHHIPALPRFKYFPKGILVMGRRFPTLVMQWIEGPTLDVYLEEMIDRPEVLWHLADEWLRLMSTLRDAGIAHGDLQHGNIIVEHGQLRLIDPDGMFVPGMAALQASELGHQHFQHPARDAKLFDATIDNFSALVIYLSLISLAERPELWDEYHDENLIFTKSDFLNPASSPLFSKIKSIGTEHRQLAEILEMAAQLNPAETPSLVDIVTPKSKLPSWMVAPFDIEIQGRTREAAYEEVYPTEDEEFWRPERAQAVPVASAAKIAPGVSAPAKPVPIPAPHDPLDIRGNTLKYALKLSSRSYFFIWWIVVQNWLDGFWSLVGVEGSITILLTLMLFVVLFLGYGFVRAILDWNGASNDPQVSFGSPNVLSILQSGPTPISAISPPAILIDNSPSAAKGGTVIGNMSLRIYHLPDCAWAKKIPRQHRLDFASPAAADAEGYRACKVCAHSRNRFIP
jgi:hypothetical protein